MGGSPASATASFKAGSLTVTAPWTRATPKGAPVAGGYLTVTNNGAESDRLVGGSFPGADRVEVHQMTMDNGVMHMRPIPDGLEIKPGQTVALTPGSYHLMFMGFKGQLKAGEQVKGTLTFEKAGTVEVTYQVGAMGGPAPAMGGHQHH
jgi:copper(I)-binding protein